MNLLLGPTLGLEGSGFCLQPSFHLQDSTQDQCRIFNHHLLQNRKPLTHAHTPEDPT